MEPLPPLSFDAALERQIIALQRRAVGEGLRGVAAERLFEGFYNRLVAAGVPLTRAFAGGRTLHPQWAGYAYFWHRDSGAAAPEHRERGEAYEQEIADSPFLFLIEQVPAAAAEGTWPRVRRRLTGPNAQLDFPTLPRIAAAGYTDYFAGLIGFAQGDTSRGQGIGYSFATDGPEGFHDNDLLLIQAVLPALSLAIMSDASHIIASGLLAAYLGEDAGRRVHAGAVERGSVESIRAVLWYADIRGFTAIADQWPGLAVIEMLNEVFEALAAPLRRRGGQVLKFLGDGLLATFPVDDATRAATCRGALDAAVEAMAALDRLNAARSAAGKPIATVDLALHLGEVLYGNIGAIDRLDFTVIGPAVNEVSRIELLCEPLGRKVLVSAELAAASGDPGRLEPLGPQALRGVREPQDVYALRLA